MLTLIGKIEAYGLELVVCDLFSIAEHLGNSVPELTLFTALSLRSHQVYDKAQSLVLFYSLFTSHLCNFADDNTLYASDLKLEIVISSLDNDMQNTLVCVECNMMVANPSKFQFICMGFGHDHKLCMEMDEMVITAVEQVKLRGVIIDSKLKLYVHVKSLCARAYRNVSSLSRAAKVIDPPQCKLLYNSFLMPTSSIAPLFGCFRYKFDSVQG